MVGVGDDLAAIVNRQTEAFPILHYLRYGENFYMASVHPEDQITRAQFAHSLPTVRSRYRRFDVERLSSAGGPAEEVLDMRQAEKDRLSFGRRVRDISLRD